MRRFCTHIFNSARECIAGVVDQRIKMRWKPSDQDVDCRRVIKVGDFDDCMGKECLQLCCLGVIPGSSNHLPAVLLQQPSCGKADPAGCAGDEGGGLHVPTVVFTPAGTVLTMARVASSLPPEDAVLPALHAGAPRPGEALPMHYAYCIGCGDKVPNGLRMTHVAGEGLQIISRFTVGEGHQGAPGLAHGGLLTLAFDEALGALNYLLGTPAVTARLDMEFLRPVPVGSVLEIHSQITGVSGRKIYKAAVGHIADDAASPVLRAQALFIEVPVSHFSTYGAPDVLAKLAADPTIAYNSASVQVNP